MARVSLALVLDLLLQVVVAAHPEVRAPIATPLSPQAHPKTSAKSQAAKAAAAAAAKPAGSASSGVGVISSAGKAVAATATVNNRCTLADLHKVRGEGAGREQGGSSAKL